MRLLYIIISLGLLTVLSRCSHKGEDRNSFSGLPQEVLDTLICSAPQNYLIVLDNFKGSRKVEIRSYEDMLSLFEELNYTPEAWQAGIREVPRVYLPQIGDRWGTTSKEVTTEDKKRIFFRGLAPLILRSNELIMVDRNRLLKIKSSLKHNGNLNEKDQLWVSKLATLYKVDQNEGQVTDAMIGELMDKVDIVPVSLALAQAAEESGWGTSRFAAQGNSVYGQWSWGSKAIVPEKQRKEMGNYGIAAFETLQESVCSYMLNLNTHNAYASLRAKRAELRKKGERISGSVLAEQLTKYSERGEDYVKTLKSMIEMNRLDPADDAYLSKDSPIYLIPAAE